jgi:Subunit CCDC53 of WASH complex
MRATFSNLLQNVAQNVSDRLFHIVPPNLDLHYINDRILAMSHCARATMPTFSDDGRKNEIIWNTNNNNNTTYRGGTKRKRSLGNNPADVSTFLQNRHDSHYLVFSLSEALPDDRSLYLLRRQLLHWKWESPGKQNSTTPCLSQLMDLCYAIHAYLNVDSRNVIVISCANGKTRSAIVIACYLKYACLVDTSIQGFAAFLQRRCPKLDSSKASMHIPPSLLQFFRNFDDALELGDFANTKPLLLRAVALEGVPVADKPCLDIWDSQQNHVYSSLSSNDSAQWADEEGFYKVNRILEGDFCLLCRFGGIYAADMDDPSKVLFRYANSIGFLNSGTYELPKKKVDMMRRYEMSFEEDDFLLTLIFESYWDNPSPTPGLELDSKQLSPILKGYAALERGWHLLTQHHAAKPIDADYHSLRSFFPELQHCPDHICKVGLQLSNFDFRQAQHLLVKGPMREWWRLGNHDDDNDSNMQLDDCDDLESTFDQPNPIRPVTPEFTPFDVLNILDDDDETDSIESGQSAPREPQHSQIRYEPILYPNRGDVVNSFRGHSKDSAKQSVGFNPIPTSTRPRIPLQKRKRAKPVNHTQSSKKVRGDDTAEEEIETALNALEQINHTGVTLDDLLNLQRTSSKIQAFQGGKEAVDDAESMFSSQDYEIKLKDTGDIRRQDTISVDGDDEDVDGFEIADENDKPGEHDQFLGFAVKGTKQDIELKVDNDGEDVPLKDDPEYSKYFKMLKMGLTIDMVKHSMTRDGKDPAIMDLDHNKSLKSQQEKPKASTDGDDPPLKEDPAYVKYFKMLKMGLPMDAVKHAMKRDGCDPSIMDLNHDMSLKSQRGGAEDDGPPLKEDPEYEKYFKMLKMGLPMGAVQNALLRDGKDPSIMDLDPNKSLKSQMASKPEDDGPPLKDDPEYEKVSTEIDFDKVSC